MYFCAVTTNKKTEHDLKSFNQNQEFNFSDVTNKKIVQSKEIEAWLLSAQIDEN